MDTTIVLIGPTGAGKSTVAALLAQHFQIPRFSIDELAGPYFTEIGLTAELYQRIEEEQGFLAVYRHWWPGYAYVLERLIADHPHGMLDLGAAHTHYEDPQLFARVKALLAPYRNVILLLPSPDLDYSIQVLRERSAREQGWEWRVETYDFIAHWVKDDCNAYLATYTIYTEGASFFGELPFALRVDSARDHRLLMDIQPSHALMNDLHTPSCSVSNNAVGQASASAKSFLCVLTRRWRQLVVPPDAQVLLSIRLTAPRIQRPLHRPVGTVAYSETTGNHGHASHFHPWWCRAGV